MSTQYDVNIDGLHQLTLFSPPQITAFRSYKSVCNILCAISMNEKLLLWTHISECFHDELSPEFIRGAFLERPSVICFT